MDAHPTLDQIARAASGLFSGRVRQTSCDFGNSHRDGPCATCIARDEHDAEIARQWREANN